MEVGRYADAKLLLPHVSVTAFMSDSTSKPAPRKQGYRRCQPSSEVGRYVDTKLLLPHVSVTAFTSDSTSKAGPQEAGLQ